MADKAELLKVATEHVRQGLHPIFPFPRWGSGGRC